MKKYFYACCYLILFYACQQKTTTLREAQQIIAAVKQEYAPDKRVAHVQIEAVQQGDSLLLQGATNLATAKAEVLKRLTEKHLEFADSIELLPSAALGSYIYGVVNLSVCNIRSQPKHSAELSTQSILGTPLRVLKQANEDWYWVQTPDDYLGWLDKGGLTLMDEQSYRSWLSSERVVIVATQSTAYTDADINSTPVSDLLAGNILQRIGTAGDFTQVRYPDGRMGFIPTTEVMSYTTWMGTRKPVAENILSTARMFMGRPYLWGGTSSNAMDCSGFTKTVFYLNGIQLPRDASQQVHTGAIVTTDTTWQGLQAGDLLFFGKKATKERAERVTHVAIYMGEGQIIHATGTVKVESLRRTDPRFAEERFNTFLRAKRPLAALGEQGVDWLRELPLYQQNGGG